jgi:FAD/FMN-containing dehydrogenase/Fe-S oxidoreductase
MQNPAASAGTEAVKDLHSLSFHGEILTDSTSRRLYATDASEYQETPLGVAFPRGESDLRELILWANRHRVGLIPRTAGTSLAGQCVGSGLVVDVSRHMNAILSVDAPARRVVVQPGVVRNELNLHLRPHGLLFGPETSTANRAMIGGMVGNNSCGSNSIVYGSTRDHLVSVHGFLSDGSEATFHALDDAAFNTKCNGPDSLETRIHRALRDLLSNPANREAITTNFPRPSIPRRNTGYALDLLMRSTPFDPHCSDRFNLCKLIAGSEGTLFIATRIELDCNPLPPPHHAVLCAHFESLDDALRANLIALRHSPSACELIDRHILECSRQNIEQLRNRAFVEGDPAAILVIELHRESSEALESSLSALEADLRRERRGYAYPILRGADSHRVWELRRAGQAIMNNVPGDAKPREVVEDTAVDVEDLPDYIAEFDALLKNKYGIRCVYYAHAGSGELHTRPIFNLKTPEGLKMFRDVATDIAALVKKYRGSLSGEHGDGRLRGEFIRFMVGDRCYDMMREVKRTFDPHDLFNPGKIIDTPPMDSHLRHGPDHHAPDFDTYFDWSDTGGMLGHAEKCTGAGDCRKSHLIGGTMCPSYMATRDERDTTRGRANMLRQLLTERGRDALGDPALKEVLDLCLSCKGCKTECPSNVDMAKLKAEFLQAHHETHGTPLRSQAVARFALAGRIASRIPWAWNLAFGTPALRRILNRLTGFHPHRTIPLMAAEPFHTWFRKHSPHPSAGQRGKVFLFADEFSIYNDTALAISTVRLLEGLGYAVEIPRQHESGRAAMSKGLLRQARHCAVRNVALLHPVVTDEIPLVGIEPSALLSFRDEYPSLLRGTDRAKALELASRTFLLEEFLVREHEAGRLPRSVFRESPRAIRLHGHCHQKALVGLDPTVRALGLVPGHSVRLIPSGCCGMAGSFGYEAEHYDLSQKIGELVLFPAVRSTPQDETVCAPGTSCRHQIHDATGRRALHPAEILLEALA